MAYWLLDEPTAFCLAFFACMIRLMRPRGLKSIAAENLILRQQLIVARRGRKRSPPLTTQDRLIFALLRR